MNVRGATSRSARRDRSGAATRSTPTRAVALAGQVAGQIAGSQREVEPTVVEPGPAVARPHLQVRAE